MNGSTDSSQQKIEKWSALDSRIRLITSDIADLGKAVNKGIDYANGSYLTFVDIDDWISSDYISKLLLGIQKGYRICKANCILYDGKENRSAYGERPKGHVSIRQASWLLPIRAAAMYDKALFSQLRYLEFSYYEDLSLWPILVAISGGLYYVNESLYYYNRTNENSMMTVKDERHLVLDKVFQFIFEHITPDLDQNVNLLITALFIQSFWSSNIKYVPNNEFGIDYLNRVKQAIDGKLVGYYYFVHQLDLPKESKEKMIHFYKNESIE